MLAAGRLAFRPPHARGQRGSCRRCRTACAGGVASCAPERVEHLFDGAPASGSSGTMRVAQVEHELAAVIGAGIGAPAAGSGASARARRSGYGRGDRRRGGAGPALQPARAGGGAGEHEPGHLRGRCDLHLVAWNTPYAQLFDYPAGMLQVGRPVAELHPLQHRRRHARARGEVEAARAAPAGVHARRHAATCPSGVSRTARSSRSAATRCPAAASSPPSPTSPRSARPRPHSNVSTRRWNCAWPNAPHELARVSAEAQAANDAKSRFLAAVTHDLMQPLACRPVVCPLAAPSAAATRRRRSISTGALAATEGLLDRPARRGATRGRSPASAAAGVSAGRGDRSAWGRVPRHGHRSRYST